MSLITVISGYLCFSKQCYIFVGNTCLNNTILQTSKVEGDLKQNGKAKHSNNIHKSAGSMLVAYCSPPPQRSWPCGIANASSPYMVALEKTAQRKELRPLSTLHKQRLRGAETLTRTGRKKAGEV